MKNSIPSKLSDLPGFVDLQVNGYLGVDFSSEALSEDSFVEAARKLLANGTAIFLPTIITSSIETYSRNLPLMTSAIKRAGLSKQIPGFHLEGPFLSPHEGARGAHQAKWMSVPDIKKFDFLSHLCDHQIRLMTLAAELPSAGELIRYAKQKGTAISLGHQLADQSQLHSAASCGADYLTHLGNGMPMQVHRHQNSLLNGLAVDKLKAMVITDGFHVPPSLVRTIFRVKGQSHFLIVSDASPIAGLPPGNYSTLGNSVVLESNGFLHNPQTGYMVGSSFSMKECVETAKSWGFFTEPDLIAAAWTNPRQVIGL